MKYTDPDGNADGTALQAVGEFAVTIGTYAVVANAVAAALPIIIVVGLCFCITGDTHQTYVNLDESSSQTLPVAGTIGGVVGTYDNDLDDAPAVPITIADTDTDDKSQQIYYRGLSFKDSEEYESYGVVLSKAVRNGEDATSKLKNIPFNQAAKQHKESSEGSPFVSVTTDPIIAESYAESGIVLKIKTKRARKNPFNYDSGYCDKEYLVPIMLNKNEIVGEY